MGRNATHVTSTEHNNVIGITVYGYQNMRIESRGMLSKRKVQESDSNPSQDSKLLSTAGWDS